MKKFVLAAAFLLGTTSAFAAESVKVAVGHMCCGSCKASATKGVTAVAWVDKVDIDMDNVTVTAKGDQKVDLVSLMDALNKAGFPAKDIQVSGPVTFTVAHMCCGGCVNDLKTKLNAINTMRLALDKDKIVIDDKAKTVTLQPEAGKSFNVVVVMNRMANTGFAACKATIAAAAVTATK